MTKQTFSTKKDALAIQAPAERDYIDVTHSTQAGLYVRVMKADARGRVRRSWVCRYQEQVPDGAGGFKQRDRKEVLGLVEVFEAGDTVLPLEDAKAAVLAKRRSLRATRVDGGKSPRLTVAQAWAFYGAERPHNRKATADKDATQYDRYLSHLKDRFLDELDYSFWSQFVSQLRNGTLVVGYREEDGQTVPITRGPLASATIIGVMNTAVTLYQIAHRYKGLQGMAQGENPAMEAKKLSGKANKRRGLIKLEHVGRSWLAAEQLLSPWWRDLFKVALLTGLRKSLLWTMRFDEIDWATGTLRIDPRKPGTKQRGTDFGREVEPLCIPLSSTVLGILRARRMFAPDQNGPVWYAPSRRRKARYTNTTLSDQRSAWEDIAKVTSGKRFSPHDLRRTFATIGSVAVQGELFGVSLLLMHSSTTLAQAVGLPEITVRYINTPSAQDKMRATTEAVAAYVARLVEQEVAGATVEQATPELPPELETAVGNEND